jgi:hypothetical protein
MSNSTQLPLSGLDDAVARLVARTYGVEIAERAFAVPAARGTPLAAFGANGLEAAVARLVERRCGVKIGAASLVRPTARAVPMASYSITGLDSAVARLVARQRGGFSASPPID